MISPAEWFVTKYFHIIKNLKHNFFPDSTLWGNVEWTRRPECRLFLLKLNKRHQIQLNSQRWKNRSLFRLKLIPANSLLRARQQSKGRWMTLSSVLHHLSCQHLLIQWLACTSTRPSHATSFLHSWTKKWGVSYLLTWRRGCLGTILQPATRGRSRWIGFTFGELSCRASFWKMFQGC